LPVQSIFSASSAMPERRAPKGKLDPQTSQIASPVIDPTAPSPPQRPATPGPQTPNANVIRAPRPPGKSVGAGAQPPQPFELTPSPDAVIHAPKSFSMTQLPRLFDSVQAIEGGVGAQRPGPIVTPASEIGVQVLSQKRAQRELEPSAQHLVEPAAKRVSEQLEVPQVPVSNAVFELPTSGATARREPKITIGQIDVQVINTPAPVQAPATSANAADSKGFMSAELDRFRWRLL